MGLLYEFGETMYRNKLWVDRNFGMEPEDYYTSGGFEEGEFELGASFAYGTLLAFGAVEACIEAPLRLTKKTLVSLLKSAS